MSGSHLHRAGAGSVELAGTEDRDAEPTGEAARSVLVVSHPAIVPANQEVYAELARRGWKVTIVLPSRWRHDYSSEVLEPQALPGLERALRPTRVLLAGRPQRYVYLARPRSVCERVAPDVAFLEAEPFALAAAQWGRSLAAMGIPFGVQCYENIERKLPLPIRWMRSRVLQKAAFVAARSETAGELARRWGARGDVALVPPAVPPWPAVQHTIQERPFTVGYAGRLVESKGLIDLLAAVRELAAPVELLLFGDGELRPQLEGQAIPGASVRVLSELTHAQMSSAYSQLDVLVLPSHTTSSWKEQFGRVIVEALSCGVPVVGSDSGEIPWLIGLTEGGLLFAEGDREALAARLAELREKPTLRAELARKGQAAVKRLFSVPAVADRLERLLVAARASGVPHGSAADPPARPAHAAAGAESRE